jgi:hypothetical protein
LAIVQGFGLFLSKKQDPLSILPFMSFIAKGVMLYSFSNSTELSKIIGNVVKPNERVLSAKN